MYIYFHCKYHHLQGEHRTSSSLEKELKNWKERVQVICSVDMINIYEHKHCIIYSRHLSVLLHLSRAWATIKPWKRTWPSSRVFLGLPGKNWRAVIESASTSPNTPALAACCRYDVEASSPIGWLNIRRKYTTTLPGLWRKSIVQEFRKAQQLSPT